MESSEWRDSRAVVTNELDRDIIVGKFELQSHYNVHFWILGKAKHLLNPLNYGLNITTTVL